MARPSRAKQGQSPRRGGRSRKTGKTLEKPFRSRRSRKPDSEATATANRQIIVLGMHRSGTSALTGALAQMGIYVGAEEDLTAKSWENPAGFFERRDARKICDTLLQGSGADWWKLSAFSVDNANYEAVRSQREAIRDLVRRLDEHGTWALKEPRLSSCCRFSRARSETRSPSSPFGIPLRSPNRCVVATDSLCGQALRFGRRTPSRCCKSVRKSIAFLWISAR